MKQGDVRWYHYKEPDKKRPVVILTRDAILEYLGEVTVAPVATTIRDIPSEVFLSRMNGMLRNCVINCDHIQTVSKNKIRGLITVISAAKLHEVSAAVSFALDL